MGLLPQILALLAMASMGASLLIARVAWPKFQAMERRGGTRKPVPVHLMGPGANSSRFFGLFWLTAIPADRPQLKRLVLAYRACHAAAGLLMLVAMATMFAPGGVTREPAPRPGTPPPVTIPISAQDH